MHHEVQATPREFLSNYEVRVVVAGSRTYNDYDFFCIVIDEYIQPYKREDIIFISGKAPKGADAMIIRYCKERGYPWVEFPADWNNVSVPGAIVAYTSRGKPYNKAAGMIRNREMAVAGNHLIAFWDTRSSGTKEMIEYAEARNKDRKRIRIRKILVDPDDGAYDHGRKSGSSPSNNTGVHRQTTTWVT